MRMRPRSIALSLSVVAIMGYHVESIRLFGGRKSTTEEENLSRISGPKGRALVDGDGGGGGGSFSLNPNVKVHVEKARNTVWYEQLMRYVTSPADNNGSNSTGCSDPTAWWYEAQADRMSYSARQFFSDNQEVLQMPLIYKYFIDQSEQGEYFGLDGEYTQELLQRQESTEDFWEAADYDDSIRTHHTRLFGMHSTDLQNRDNLVATLNAMYVFRPPSYVYEEADRIANGIRSLPDGFRNPLLTVNALAIDDESAEEGYSAILIGDGLLEMLDALELERDGPDFAHAHEFGHHMQFEADVVEDVPSLIDSEDSRRMELMADAFSAYFLAHDRGANMEGDQVLQLFQTAMAIGDCEICDPGHHGTPKERARAARWGADLADSNSTHIIHPREFVRQFDAALPDLVISSMEGCPTRSAASLHGPEGTGISAIVFIAGVFLTLFL